MACERCIPSSQIRVTVASVTGAVRTYRDVSTGGTGVFAGGAAGGVAAGGAAGRAGVAGAGDAGGALCEQATSVASNAVRTSKRCMEKPGVEDGKKVMS